MKAVKWSKTHADHWTCMVGGVECSVSRSRVTKSGTIHSVPLCIPGVRKPRWHSSTTVVRAAIRVGDDWQQVEGNGMFGYFRSVRDAQAAAIRAAEQLANDDLDLQACLEREIPHPVKY